MTHLAYDPAIGHVCDEQHGCDARDNDFTP